MPDFNLALASPEASDRLAAVRELKNSLIGSRTRKTLFIQVRSQLSKRVYCWMCSSSWWAGSISPVLRQSSGVSTRILVSGTCSVQSFVRLLLTLILRNCEALLRLSNSANSIARWCQPPRPCWHTDCRAQYVLDVFFPLSFNISFPLPFLQSGALAKLAELTRDHANHPEISVQAAMTIGSLAFGTEEHVAASCNKVYSLPTALWRSSISAACSFCSVCLYRCSPFVCSSELSRALHYDSALRQQVFVLSFSLSLPICVLDFTLCAMGTRQETVAPRPCSFRNANCIGFKMTVSCLNPIVHIFRT